MYLLRLDDACEKRDLKKWDKIEALLDKYSIKPIIGIIPKCEDKDMEQYPVDEKFWLRASCWQEKGWHIALHGYEHVFCSREKGLNPVNDYSEFAGVSLDEQRKKIAAGVKIMKEHGISPEIFFAPAHTYDSNTLLALKEESEIRIISDTVAYDSYFFDGFTFIPQQSGKVRDIPLKMVTFCYHPNLMKEKDFIVLEDFIKRNHKRFFESNIVESTRKLNLIDRLLKYLYFVRR